MDLELGDKIAIVTGGSEGIGKAAALSLSLEGATVVICARRPKILERTASKIRSLTNRDVLAITADVTKPEQLETLFDTVATTYGGPDILVNNAGTASAMQFEAATEQTWQMDLDLKLFGAIRPA
jgi:NAD(P)-dependent dehydrogenase (short-subunit alcohol dehydrogenase family)